MADSEREKEQERRRLEEKETEERKAKEEVVAEKEEAKVDEENNSIPVTPVRKVLSRTSSFEVKIPSKMEVASPP